MATVLRVNEQDGMYFLTFTVVDWVDVFTREQYRQIVTDTFKFYIKAGGISIKAWVIMSNHIHLIASSPDKDLSGVIRDIKKYTSIQIIKAIQAENESRKEWMLKIFSEKGQKNSNNKNFQLWQQKYHAEWLQGADFINQKLHYIHSNPVRAGLVNLAEEYVYSSARDYAGEVGLIPVDKINPLTLYKTGEIIL